MSMREYAVNDYGLVLDGETMKLIASKMFDDFADYDEEYDGDWGYELYDKGICEYIVDFTGEAQEVDSNGHYWGENSIYYEGDAICYISVSNYPTLFRKAYNNINELVEEFKEKVGKYLPEDFDYRSRICHICGTYYG